jgi:membrane protein DedA with SNARE-associated domain
MHLSFKLTAFCLVIPMLFVASIGAFAQDTIWFSNGKKEIGKVLLINKGEVNFRKQALTWKSNKKLKTRN